MEGCKNDKNDDNENVYFWNNFGQWMTLSGVFEVLTKIRIGHWLNYKGRL